MTDSSAGCSCAETADLAGIRAGMDRNEQELKQLTAAIYGNGTDGMKARLIRLEERQARHNLKQWLILAAIIAGAVAGKLNLDSLLALI